MRFVWILVQVAFLACAYLPGVTHPARGALLLVSFWCFGCFAGTCLARRGGDAK